MPCTDSRQQILAELGRRLRQVEDAARNVRRPGSPDDVISTGIAPLDAWLPRGGLAGGTLIEWLAEGDGSGAEWLALKIAAQLQRPDPQSAIRNRQSSLPRGRRKAVVIIDLAREFYPPAAHDLGLSLDDVLVVRPRNAADALWAFEQSLCCPGVAAALGRFGRLPGRAGRRLQLATETGGGLGLIVRPSERWLGSERSGAPGPARAEGSLRSAPATPSLRDPSWADLRLLVRPVAGWSRSATGPSPLVAEAASFGVFTRQSRTISERTGETWCLQLELLHSRRGFAGALINLEINDASGAIDRSTGFSRLRCAINDSKTSPMGSPLPSDDIQQPPIGTPDSPRRHSGAA